MPNPPLSEAEPQSDPNPEQPQVIRGRPKSKRTPELEVALGARIRAARVSAGMSQTALGAVLGISFQQVQKYERGADRIAASTLQKIAAAMGVHPGSFYDEGPLPTGSITDNKTAQKIAKLAQRIQNPPVLKRILALMEYFASSENVAEGFAANGRGTVNDDEPG